MSAFTFKSLWEGKRELALVLGVVGILLLLFTPIPAPLLDVLLILNITMALLVLPIMVVRVQQVWAGAGA